MTEQLPVSDRRMIAVNDRRDDILDTSWDALTVANDRVFPRVLRNGGRLVRVIADADDGVTRLAGYDRAALHERLIRVADYVRPRGDGYNAPADVPAGIIDMILECHALWDPKAPAVSRVTTAPVFDGAGALVSEPGYHPESGLYYAPDPELAGTDFRPYLEPDPAMLGWAVSILLDLVADFPFSEEADRTNAIALLLLPFVRELVQGPTPVHAVISPTAGTGKTLLAQVLLYPAIGPTAIFAEPRSEEEWRKALTTYLLSGPSAIVFDNLSRLDSQALAAAVTSPTCTWTDRILGATEQASMRVRTAWVVTGNNISLTTEQARRVCPIVLTSETERPWQRTGFRHPDLLAYARANRATLVGAALAVVGHWLAVPEEHGTRAGSLVLGSFESWARRIGGILADAGISGFMANHSTFAQSEDSDDEGLSEFLEAWHALGRGPIKLRDIESLVAPLGPLRDSAPADLRAARDNERAKVLSYWLRAHRGRVSGGYRLALINPGERTRLWEAEEV